MSTYLHKRGTRAQIEAAATASQLRAGEVYLITDENRLTVGLSANSHSPAFREGPLFRTDNNTLSQHNGVDAQTWRLYRTRTDDLNGEWLEANTSFFGAVPYVRLQALANGTGSASIGIALTPRGTGGITATVPDGTAVGGNARGGRSVDLQHDRVANTQVASGTSSVVCGGRDNTASESFAVVVGGSGNIASGQFSNVMGGLGNSATGSGSWIPGGARAITRGILGAFAWGFTRRVVSGDVQTFGMVLSNTTTSDTPLILTANRAVPAVISATSTNVAVLPDNSSYTFNLLISARSDTGLTARWNYDVTVKRGVGVGTTELVSATLVSSHVEPGLVGIIGEPIADTVLGSAQVRATGLAATTIDWYAQMMGGQLVR